MNRRGARVGIVLLLTLAIGLAALPESASAGNAAVARAIDDLKICTQVDAHMCRAIPSRLSAYGTAALRPLERVFPTLAQAGKILAVVAFRSIDGKKSTAALVRLERKANRVVRLLILTALGERTGKAVEKTFIVALSDDLPTVRQVAAEALGRHPGQRHRKRVVGPLLKAVGDPVIVVARTALESVAMLRDKRALPHIRTALASDSSIWQQSGLFCLRFVSEPSIVPAVIELLRNEDTVLARDALRTLQRLTHKEYGPDYVLWKGWWALEHED